MSQRTACVGSFEVTLPKAKRLLSDDSREQEPRASERAKAQGECGADGATCAGDED